VRRHLHASVTRITDFEQVPFEVHALARDRWETADYVLVDRLSATTAMYLIPAIAANLERFEVVHTVGGEEGTALLRLLSAPRTASAPGEP